MLREFHAAAEKLFTWSDGTLAEAVMDARSDLESERELSQLAALRQPNQREN